jgi:hypothetical protein
LKDERDERFVIGFLVTCIHVTRMFCHVTSVPPW